MGGSCSDKATGCPATVGDFTAETRLNDMKRLSIRPLMVPHEMIIIFSDADGGPRQGGRKQKEVTKS